MVILVTGATGGLGPAVVKAFLDSGAAAVFGVALSWDGRGLPEGNFHPIEADLTTVDGCRHAAARAQPVDALVHVMGGFAGGAPVGETTDDVWNRMMDLNLRSAFYMIREVLPPMLEAGSGRIIAVGSRTGVEPAANLSAYAVSKAALHMLVRTVALEVAGSGVTANAVLPSTIDTAANRKAMPRADHTKWVKPEAIAEVLVWLASSEAAEVNGALIPVYGRS
jgi:NAD(P)-dependent dehydrogenase (short-subunit alcohol dehydrogenase family)